MRKPKKIPKGFEWDPKARELIDTRCNNSKLRKMMKNAVRVDTGPLMRTIPTPAICISPFYTIGEKKPTIRKVKVLKGEDKKRAEAMKLNPDDLVIVKDSGLEKIVGDPVSYLLKGLKRKRPKELPWQRYQSIALLASNARLRRSILGLYLQWTIKEDGENVTIWMKKKKYVKGSSSLYTGLITIPRGFEVKVSSHNQEDASADITGRTQGCPEYQKILKLIVDNPTYRVVVEECKKGRSVTNVKDYPRAILYVVDIFDAAINNYLPYTLVYQTCYHYDIPVVALFATTRHKTIRDLNAYIGHVLEHCIAVKEEGMVVKAFNKANEYIQGKVKVDTPKPTETKIREGPPKFPQIPESEIMGAISHVEADFGLTGNPKDDMPRVAKAVSEECRKHFYSSRGNLFQFYQDYMERRKQ